MRDYIGNIGRNLDKTQKTDSDKGLNEEYASSVFAIHVWQLSDTVWHLSDTLYISI